jgi:hypothetical protein
MRSSLREFVRHANIIGLEVAVTSEIREASTAVVDQDNDESQDQGGYEL